MRTYEQLMQILYFRKRVKIRHADLKTWKSQEMKAKTLAIKSLAIE